MGLMDRVLQKTARATELARIQALHKATGAALAAIRSKSGSRPALAPAKKGGPTKRRVVRKANDEMFEVYDVDVSDVQVRDEYDVDVSDVDVSDSQVR